MDGKGIQTANQPEKGAGMGEQRIFGLLFLFSFVVLLQTSAAERRINIALDSFCKLVKPSTGVLQLC